MYGILWYIFTYMNGLNGWFHAELVDKYTVSVPWIRLGSWFDIFPFSRRCQQVPINGWSSGFGGVFLHTTPQFTTTAEGGEDDDTFKGIPGNILRWERDVCRSCHVCLCEWLSFFEVDFQMFICICIFQMGWTAHNSSERTVRWWDTQAWQERYQNGSDILCNVHPSLQQLVCNHGGLWTRHGIHCLLLRCVCVCAWRWGIEQVVYGMLQSIQGAPHIGWICWGYSRSLLLLVTTDDLSTGHNWIVSTTDSAFERQAKGFTSSTCIRVE